VRKATAFPKIIGASTVSWEAAAKNAVDVAAKSLRDPRVAESASST
jgi:flavin-binding protein dodecin